MDRREGIFLFPNLPMTEYKTSDYSPEAIDLEFDKEVFWNRFFERAGLILGYGAYLVCFIIVFGLKMEAVQYASLFYLGLFTRFSSLLIGKFYEIPKVFRNLFSNDTELVLASQEYLKTHREKAFLRLAGRLYGMNDASQLYNANQEELIELLRPKMEKPWKKVGKIYFFYFYIPVSLILIGISVLN